MEGSENELGVTHLQITKQPLKSDSLVERYKEIKYVKTKNKKGKYEV
jgi:hypothetical protein